MKLILKKTFHTIDNGLLAHKYIYDKRSTTHIWIVSYLKIENDVFSLIRVTNESFKGWYLVYVVSSILRPQLYMYYVGPI